MLPPPYGLFCKPAHGVAAEGPPILQGIGIVEQTGHMAVAPDDAPAEIPVMTGVLHGDVWLCPHQGAGLRHHIAGFSIEIVGAGLDKELMGALLFLAPQAIADARNGNF